MLGDDGHPRTQRQTRSEGPPWNRCGRTETRKFIGSFLPFVPTTNRTRTNYLKTGHSGRKTWCPGSLIWNTGVLWHLGSLKRFTAQAAVSLWEPLCMPESQGVLDTQRPNQITFQKESLSHSVLKAAFTIHICSAYGRRGQVGYI